MEDHNTSFELRSEEVQEILTRVPHWIIRWGSVVILTIMAMLFFVSWLVKYPDIIPAEIIITTNVPPQKLKAKTSGKIETILVRDKAVISKNTAMAIIENTANYKDVFLLKSIVDTIDIDKSSFPFEKLKALQLGDIESSFAVFEERIRCRSLEPKTPAL
ncbi:hypothetical protein [Flavobacterium sp.]|uniref:hypothetical protein n=1 Tax=Flavobacterium sp. TaxID=239 RepID=UPI0039E306E8